jgi:hypothetical protein
MSDDHEPRPTDPDAPVAPTAAVAPAPPGQPVYAAQERPRFADQVMGMRAVVAVALACLVIGGLSGYILGHAAGSDGRFGPGPGFFQERRAFPQGQSGLPVPPNGPFGQQPSQGRSGR